MSFKMREWEFKIAILCFRLVCNFNNLLTDKYAYLSNIYVLKIKFISSVKYVDKFY